MTRINEGDRVIVAARPQTAADIKSQLYYPHYSNLQGTVLKLFGEEASVLVDRTTLPDSIRARHEDMERAARKRYLDNLSEEGRNRASDKEKLLHLNYAILVSVSDLAPGSSETVERRATEDDLTAAEAAFLAERAKKTG